MGSLPRTRGWLIAGLLLLAACHRDHAARSQTPTTPQSRPDAGGAVAPTGATAPQSNAASGPADAQIAQMKSLIAAVDSSIEMLRRAIADIRAGDARQGQETAALERLLSNLEEQSRRNSAAVQALEQAQIEMRGTLSAADTRLVEAQRKTADTARFLGALQSDILSLQARRLADNTSIVSSISSLAQQSARLKALQDELVAGEAARRSAAAARRAAAGKALDNFIPCELDPRDADGLKPGQAARPTDLQSGLADLVRRGYQVRGDFESRVRENQGSPAPIPSAVNQMVNNDEIVGLPGQTKAETKEKVTETLTATISDLAAPTDVGCQMIMLPWHVTADSFGRHVADQFIAFQVIVRNLNATQEFVLHNTSIALDTGRFYAGVDRMLVRNTQQHGNYYDRRNFWMRVLEVAGDIAAGAAPYASGDTQSGIAVFRAAFIPGMQKIFPDRYLNQINALNDLGFSASTAYKMVIPVKGSAPFVTFLPADMFSRKQGTAVAGDKKWHYKDWDADQLYNFAENTYVIVAGVHVTPTQNLQPTLTSIDCKTDASTKNLTCTLKGQNLDKVAKARLKNAVETTDTVTAEGDVSLAGGQNTTATVTFQAADIAKLKGSTYAVLLVAGGSNAEIPTTITVTIPPSLASTSVPLRLGDANCLETGCAVTISGGNLQQVKQGLLVDSSGAPKATGDVDPSSTGDSLKIHFASLSNIVSSGDYTLNLVNAGAVLGSITLKITLVPSVDSIAPQTYSKANPGCSTDCSFQLTGQRLKELTNVGLTDSGGTVKVSGTYDASTSKVTFKKTDLDTLSGTFTVYGKTKDGQSDAITSAKLTIGP